MFQRPKWLGNFYGGNLGFLNYEVLTIQHIPYSDFKNESELCASKWFDYRRLHPMQATYYFVRCYNDAYRNFWHKAVDSRAAPFVRAFKGHDFLQSGQERLTIWRLRQLVDRLGMRYDFFLNFALGRHYRMVMEKSGKIVTPRPCHLLNNEDLIADAMLAWEENCQARVQFALDPYYRVSNFTGTRDQLDYETFIINQIKNRQHAQYALSAAFYRHDVVRIEQALRDFDERVVLDAIKQFDLAK